MMAVLAKDMVMILQCVSISNQHLYILNLHNVMCQLKLNKAGTQNKTSVLNSVPCLD